jgi:hypothetical protein
MRNALEEYEPYATELERYGLLKYVEAIAMWIGAQSDEWNALSLLDSQRWGEFALTAHISERFAARASERDVESLRYQKEAVEFMLHELNTIDGAPQTNRWAGRTKDDKRSPEEASRRTAQTLVSAMRWSSAYAGFRPEATPIEQVNFAMRIMDAWNELEPYNRPLVSMIPPYRTGERTYTEVDPYRYFEVTTAPYVARVVLSMLSSLRYVANYLDWENGWRAPANLRSVSIAYPMPDVIDGELVSFVQPTIYVAVTGTAENNKKDGVSIPFELVQRGARASGRRPKGYKDATYPRVFRARATVLVATRYRAQRSVDLFAPLERKPIHRGHDLDLRANDYATIFGSEDIAAEFRSARFDSIEDWQASETWLDDNLETPREIASMDFVLAKPTEKTRIACDQFLMPTRVR